MLKKKIDFNKKAKNISKNYLNLIGLEIQSDIITRTQRGIDKNGKQFKGYSPSTIKKKGSSIVNLQDTFKMLNSLKFEPIKGGIRFYLAGVRKEGLSNNDVAYYNKKNGREFLGLSKKEITEVKKELTKIYKKQLINK